MAGTAIILRWDMGVCLARGYLAVVAGLAVIKNIGVIECRSHKGIGGEMAERTVLGSGQVIVRKSCADHTVMAG